MNRCHLNRQNKDGIINNFSHKFQIWSQIFTSEAICMPYWPQSLVFEKLHLKSEKSAPAISQSICRNSVRSWSCSKKWCLSFPLPRQRYSIPWCMSIHGHAIVCRVGRKEWRLEINENKGLGVSSWRTPWRRKWFPSCRSFASPSANF